MANLESIITTNAIGLVLLAGLFITSRMARGRHYLEDRIFTFDILVCAGACVVEPLTWLADGQPGMLARAIVIVGNAYLYASTNVYAYFWVLYVELRLNKADGITHWFPGLLVPTVLLTMLNIGNIFGQYMFVVDAHNVYARLPLSYANYVMPCATLFYSVHLRNKYQRELGSARFFPIALFLAPVFVGALLQALFYGLSLAWPSVCVGLVLIYMSQQNELSYVDSLTGLYNRTYLNYIFHRMQHEGRTGGGIMIDLDYFKEINDTYGHSMGDDALRQVARIITKAMPKSAMSIRFAGDEFIVLVDTTDNAEIVRIEENVRRELSEFNASGRLPFEIALSMGYSVFNAGSDTTDSFLRRMDAYMYEEKQKKHATRA